MNDLIEAARALVERWDTPLWKEAAHTGEYINRLRAALAAAEAQAADDCVLVPKELLERLMRGMSAKMAEAQAKPDSPAEPLKGWKLNHVQFVRGSGTAQIGYLDPEDDQFSPFVTIDTGLYYQPDQAYPLAVSILEMLTDAAQAPAAPPQAQPAQEPVAWLMTRTDPDYPGGYVSREVFINDEHKKDWGTAGWAPGFKVTPLYASPHQAPAAPAKAPLTDEQIERIADSVPVDKITTKHSTWHIRLVRAIERAHGIGAAAAPDAHNVGVQPRRQASAGTTG